MFRKKLATDVRTEISGSTPYISTRWHEILNEQKTLWNRFYLVPKVNRHTLISFLTICLYPQPKTKEQVVHGDSPKGSFGSAKNRRFSRV